MLTNNKGERIHFLLTEQGFVLESSEDETFLRCPNWALRCRHVAAVLYGIAVK